MLFEHQIEGHSFCGCSHNLVTSSQWRPQSNYLQSKLSVTLKALNTLQLANQTLPLYIPSVCPSQAHFLHSSSSAWDVIHQRAERNVSKMMWPWISEWGKCHTGLFIYFSKVLSALVIRVRHMGPKHSERTLHVTFKFSSYSWAG